MDGSTVRHLRGGHDSETDSNLVITLVCLGAVAFVSIVLCLLAYCLRGKKLWRSNSEQWYFQGPTKQMGPFSRSRMSKHLAAGNISPTTMVKFDSESYAPLQMFFPDSRFFQQVPIIPHRRGSANSVYSRMSADPGRARATLAETAFAPQYVSLAHPQSYPPSHPQSFVRTATCPGPWYYKTLKNEVHGPYSAENMRHWFDHKKFPLYLPVSLGRSCGPFVSLSTVFPGDPFASTPNYGAFAPQYTYPQSCYDAPAANWQETRGDFGDARRNAGYVRSQSAVRSRPERAEAKAPLANVRAQSTRRSRPGSMEPVSARSQETEHASIASAGRRGSAARNAGRLHTLNIPARGTDGRDIAWNSANQRSPRKDMAENGTAGTDVATDIRGSDREGANKYVTSAPRSKGSDTPRDGKENADPQTKVRRGANDPKRTQRRRHRGARSKARSSSHSSSSGSVGTQQSRSRADKRHYYGPGCDRDDSNNSRDIERRRGRTEKDNVKGDLSRRNTSRRLDEPRACAFVREEPVSNSLVNAQEPHSEASTAKRRSAECHKHANRQPLSANSHEAEDLPTLDDFLVSVRQTTHEEEPLRERRHEHRYRRRDERKGSLHRNERTHEASMDQRAYLPQPRKESRRHREQRHHYAHSSQQL